jgi:hypothetical protein
MVGPTGEARPGTHWSSGAATLLVGSIESWRKSEWV